MANVPSFFLSGKNKQTGESVDIATVFPSKSGKGYSVLLKPGTVIKVTSVYNRDSKQVEMLSKPVYVEMDNSWLNLNPNPRAENTEKDVDRVFDTKGQRSQSFDDLPF
jgi:hypothetical protein